MFPIEMTVLMVFQPPHPLGQTHFHYSQVKSQFLMVKYSSLRQVDFEMEDEAVWRKLGCKSNQFWETKYSPSKMEVEAVQVGI